ncbi:MAG: TetR/AcrR family transcriptional regulator [Clostridia bacterium]|nr:TetR/AcrR family transcriptional regulator [Clostridia bacterium]
MKHEETRRRLIEGTIRVIARDGLDKATTKLIGLETSINEAYIYRCFSNKEDMFSKTFDCLDEELMNVVMQNVPLMFMSEMEGEVRCRVVFSSVWRFLLGNREKCLTFVRYYYSPYFKKYSQEAHKRRYDPIVNELKRAFRDEANVWMLLNHMLNVMLDFAVKVFSDALPDNEDTAEHVFRLIYVSVKQYFRTNKTQE